MAKVRITVRVPVQQLAIVAALPLVAGAHVPSERFSFVGFLTCQPMSTWINNVGCTSRTSYQLVSRIVRQYLAYHAILGNVTARIVRALGKRCVLVQCYSNYCAESYSVRYGMSVRFRINIAYLSALVCLSGACDPGPLLYPRDRQGVSAAVTNAFVLRCASRDWLLDFPSVRVSRLPQDMAVPSRCRRRESPEKIQILKTDVSYDFSRITIFER